MVTKEKSKDNENIFLLFYIMVCIHACQSLWSH